MLEFIKNNKEWLFSGAGISILTALFLIVRHIFAKKTKSTTSKELQIHEPKRTNDEKTSKDNVLPSSSEYSAHPSPGEIAQSISDLPPFQQNTAKENYIGINICWDLTLSLVYSKEEDIVSLMCQSKGYSRYVGVEISLNRYPQIKVIHKDQRLIVYGEIKDIESSGPQVIAHKIEFK